METGSNEAMYALSLVVLMVSAGHNSLQHTHARVRAQMNAHSYVCTYTHTGAPKAILLTLSLSLCVRPTLHLGQCKEDIWMCGAE